MKPSENLKKLLSFYESELLDNVIPWWMEHGVDRRHGGILQCIEDDGTVINTDKYMWSQLRALYIFSALYNRIGKRHEWLDVAENIFEFVLPNGRDEEGCWVCWLDENGRIKEGANSIYSDGFAIMGMTEYARATGDERAIEAALETYGNVQKRLALPGSYLTAPYVVPAGGKAHGVSMIFSTVFHELGKLSGDAEILQAGYRHVEQIMNEFLRPDRKLLLEYVSLDGSELGSQVGRAVCPGHAIESMWFVTHICRDRREHEYIDRAIESIKWHIEAGWDREYGGILLAVDADGNPEPEWAFHDIKTWWPHTEALYALLLAYEHCGEQWCLDWYDRVHEWSFAHFPVPEHGEWYMRLDRQGSVPRELLSLHAVPIKDPFHTPRAWMKCIDVLERLQGDSGGRTRAH